MSLVVKLGQGLRRLTVLPALHLLARVHFRRGDLRGALARCNRAIAIEPNSFEAHVLRGKIFLRRKDFLKARRDFLYAQEIDEQRFQRVMDGLQRATGGININLFYFPPTPVAQEPTREDFLEDFLAADDDRLEPQPTARCIGDFVSRAEARKFRRMGPITKEEIENTDWDRVASELLE